MKNNIFHIDMDCFFVAIETLLNPIYKNKPTVVGGRNKKGVVASANYEARKLGIKSAMPIQIALKIYPHLLIADHHMDQYLYYSVQIHNFLMSLLKKIEQGSIDEWFIDVNGSRFESWNEIEFGSFLKKIMKKKFHLNSTIGCSYNKFLAKMATNLAKPDGFLILNETNFKEKLYHLGVDKMIFVGKKTAQILKEHGINTIADVTNYSNDRLITNLLGINWKKIKNDALGKSCSTIEINHNKKNLGKSCTIENFCDFKEFEKLLKIMTMNLQDTLKNEELKFQSFTLKIYLKNGITFVKTIRYNELTNFLPINDVMVAFDSCAIPKFYQDIKKVELTLNNIIETVVDCQQPSIFNFENKKNNDLKIIKNKVNEFFGKKILFTLKN